MTITHIKSLGFDSDNELIDKKLINLQVEKWGPYVYNEQQRKHDVTMVGANMHFYLWKHQTFDPGITAQECYNCSQHDEVTINH